MEGTGDYRYANQVRPEEHVLSQTRDVFVHFVQERVRIDEERDESKLTHSTPRGTYPEIARLVNDQHGTNSQVGGGNSNTKEVGVRLAKIGDDIARMYAGEFKDMQRQLEGKNISTYESFKQIANRIFGDKEVNWGRITALFSFGYVLFKNVIGRVASSIRKVVTDIAANIYRFFEEGALGITQWIARQGGWSSANNYSLPSVRPVVFWGILGAAAVTIGAVVWLKSGK